MKKFAKHNKVLASVVIALALFTLVVGKPNKTSTTNMVVRIKNGDIVPKSVTISQGDSLTIVNTDQATYKVVSEHEGFESDVLDSQQTYTFIFNTKGTWKYGLAEHSLGMQNEVEVR